MDRGEEKTFLLLCRDHHKEVDKQYSYDEISILCYKCGFPSCMECLNSKLDYQEEVRCPKCNECTSSGLPLSATNYNTIEVRNKKNFSYCEKHPDYHCIYATKDNNNKDILICPYCKENGEHSDKKTVLIEEIVKSAQESIKKTTYNIDKLMISVDERINSLKSDSKSIESYYDRLFEQAEKQKNMFVKHIEQCSEEKKENMEKSSFGNLLEIEGILKRRIKEIEFRQKLMKNFQASALNKRKVQLMIPYLNRKQFWDDYIEFKKEMDSKLKYPKACCGNVSLKKSLKPANIEDLLGGEEIHMARNESIEAKITGYDFENFEIGDY